MDRILHSFVKEAAKSSEMSIPYALAMRTTADREKTLPLEVRDELWEKGTNYILRHPRKAEAYGVSFGAGAGTAIGGLGGFLLHKKFKKPAWAIPAAAAAGLLGGTATGAIGAKYKLKALKKERRGRGSILARTIASHTPSSRIRRGASHVAKDIGIFRAKTGTFPKALRFEDTSRRGFVTPLGGAFGSIPGMSLEEFLKLQSGQGK